MREQLAYGVVGKTIAKIAITAGYKGRAHWFQDFLAGHKTWADVKGVRPLPWNR